LDSALYVEAGKSSFLNLNDTKPSGLTAFYLKSLCPSPTFLLKSYASASPIPLCIESRKSETFYDAALIKNKYISEFVKAISFFNPQFAVPFASNHCFGRPDTFKYNSYSVNPYEIGDHDYFSSCSVKSKLVPMPNGSSYDDAVGFNITYDRSFFSSSNVIKTINLGSRKSLIDAQMRREAKSNVNIKAAHKYFKAFVSSLPFFLKILLPPIIIFVFGRDKRPYMVNTRTSACKSLTDNQESAFILGRYPLSLIVSIPPAIFNDCNIKSMYNTLTPSKIVKFSILGSFVSRLQLYVFLSLIDMYENSYFDLRVVFSRRALSIIFSRILEIFDVLFILPLSLVLKKVFAVVR